MKSLVAIACLLVTLNVSAQLWQAETLASYASESAATSTLDGLSSGPAYQNAGLIPVPNRGIYSSGNDLMSWVVFRQPPTWESAPCESDQGNASPPVESRSWVGHPNCTIILDTVISTTAPTSYANAKSFRDGLSTFMRSYAALLPFPSVVAFPDRWYVAYRDERTICFGQ